MIASVLVGLLVLSIIFVGHFLSVLCFQEGSDAYIRLQSFVEKQLSNQVKTLVFI